MTKEQIEKEFLRQCNLNRGIGYDKMLEIVNKFAPIASDKGIKSQKVEIIKRLKQIKQEYFESNCAGFEGDIRELNELIEFMDSQFQREVKDAEKA